MQQKATGVGLREGSENKNKLKKNGRVIFVSSGGMYLKALSLDDLNFVKSPYNPYKAYALAAQAFYPQPKPESFRAPGAVIDPAAVIGADCHIGHGAVIGKGVKIGDRSRIPRLVDGGLPVVLSQTFRTLIHSRLELGLKGYESSHPQTDILLFEPDQRDPEMFLANTFSYSQRRHLAEHAYQATRRQLLERAQDLARLALLEQLVHRQVHRAVVERGDPGELVSGDKVTEHCNQTKAVSCGHAVGVGRADPAQDFVECC